MIMDYDFIVSLNSPLRTIPSNIEPKERIFFDGIRYGIQMIGLSYSRLEKMLAAPPAPDNNQTKEESTYLFTAAYLDAWSIVDSCHRIKPLIEKFTHIQNHPDVQKLLNELSAVRNARDNVQHIYVKYQGFAKEKSPTWGSITWITVDKMQPLEFRSHTLTAGTVFDTELPVENPGGKMIRTDREVNRISLIAHDEVIDISQLFHSIRKFTHLFENSLNFPKDPGGASDIYTCASMTAGEK